MTDTATAAKEPEITMDDPREEHRDIAAHAGGDVAERNDRPETLLQAIYMAATNPTVDLDRLDRLIQLQRQIEADEARKAYHRALPTMQSKLPIIEKRGRISGKTKSGADLGDQPYGRWEDIYEEIQPILAKYGFALSFRPGRDGDRVTMTAILSHRDGHAEEATVPIGPDLTGSKNAAQAIGSSMSYAKRYAAVAILNIATRGEDDDGLMAATITAEQYLALERKMEELNVGADRVCRYATRLAKFEITAITQIPTEIVEQIISAMEANAGRVQQAAEQ